MNRQLTAPNPPALLPSVIGLFTRRRNPGWRSKPTWTARTPKNGRKVA
jgi:hypothetical protein